MATECYVSAVDYRAHWDAAPPPAVVEASAWTGHERRVGPADRRAPDHERRWSASSGRRYRLADRRRAG